MSILNRKEIEMSPRPEIEDVPKWNERIDVNPEMESKSFPCRFIKYAGSPMTGQYLGNIKIGNTYSALVLWNGSDMVDSAAVEMIEISRDGISWEPLENYITKED